MDRDRANDRDRAKTYHNPNLCLVTSCLILRRLSVLFISQALSPASVDSTREREKARERERERERERVGV
jgi:hypothetical protein